MESNATGQKSFRIFKQCHRDNSAQPRSENSRKLVKNRVAEKQPSISETLREVINEVWAKEISFDYCNNLVPSLIPPNTSSNQQQSGGGGHTKILTARLFYLEWILNLSMSKFISNIEFVLFITLAQLQGGHKILLMSVYIIIIQLRNDCDNLTCFVQVSRTSAKKRSTYNEKCNIQ